ncbi:MAG: hypothetical protein RBS80_24730 [Thermoguttaceae bacterium]|jgi:hypothetical protein|nr:hypothetical protein [Thermoguttaceae bacterium]
MVTREQARRYGSDPDKVKDLVDIASQGESMGRSESQIREKQRLYEQAPSRETRQKIEGEILVEAAVENGYITREQAKKIGGDPDKLQREMDKNDLVETGYATKEQIEKVGDDDDALADLTGIAIEGELLGLDPDTIKEHQEGYAEKPSKEAREKIRKDMVVEGRNLPDEAKDTDLDAGALMELVSEIESLGSDDAQSPDLWNQVKNEGKDAALKEVIQDVYGLPENAMEGRTPEDIMGGVALVEMGGGDPSDVEVWEDLDDLRAGKIDSDKFLENFAARRREVGREWNPR